MLNHPLATALQAVSIACTEVSTLLLTMGDEPYIDRPKQPDSAPARFMAAVTAARQAAAQAGEAGDVGEPELWELPAGRLAADPAAANFLK